MRGKAAGNRGGGGRNQASAKLMWPRFGATPRVCNMYHRHIWMRTRVDKGHLE